MRPSFLLSTLTALVACGGNPPCVECPDVSGRFVLTSEAVDALKSTCLGYYAEGYSTDVVVHQVDSRVVVEPFGWEGTLHENLELKFLAADGDNTSNGYPTRERLKGRVKLEPVVSFLGKLTVDIPKASCGLVVPVSWK